MFDFYPRSKEYLLILKNQGSETLWPFSIFHLRFGLRNIVLLFIQIDIITIHCHYYYYYFSLLFIFLLRVQRGGDHPWSGRNCKVTKNLFCDIWFLSPSFYTPSPRNSKPSRPKQVNMASKTDCPTSYWNRKVWKQTTPILTKTIHVLQPSGHR